MKICLIIFIILLTNFIRLGIGTLCSNNKSPEQAAPSSSLRNAEYLIRETDSELEEHAYRFKFAHQQIFRADQRWKQEWQTRIEEQQKSVQQTFAAIQILMDSDGVNCIRPSEYDPVRIADEAERMQAEAIAAREEGNARLEHARELRESAEIVQQDAAEALVQARHAVKRAEAMLRCAEKRAQHSKARLESAKTAEMQEEQKLHELQYAEQQARVRMPILQELFEQMEEALSAKHVLRRDMDAQVGRHEALRRHITAAERPTRALYQAKRKQLLLLEIQDLANAYHHKAKYGTGVTVIDAYSMEPIVNSRNKILYLATEYFGITMEQIQDAQQDCDLHAQTNSAIEPHSDTTPLLSRSHTFSGKNGSSSSGRYEGLLSKLFCNIGKVDEEKQSVPNNDLLSLIGEAMCMYKEMEKRVSRHNVHKLKTNPEHIRHVGKLVDEQVQDQIEAEKQRLGISEFPISELRAKFLKGKEKVEQIQDEESSSSIGQTSMVLSSVYNNGDSKNSTDTSYYSL